jgi:hypothetical protein
VSGHTTGQARWLRETADKLGWNVEERRQLCEAADALDTLLAEAATLREALAAYRSAVRSREPETPRLRALGDDALASSAQEPATEREDDLTEVCDAAAAHAARLRWLGYPEYVAKAVRIENAVARLPVRASAQEPAPAATTETTLPPLPPGHHERPREPNRERFG